MNKAVFDLTGITALHERGLYGEGVKVLVHENDKDSPHAYMSAEIIRQIAPKAIVTRWNPSQATYKEDMDSMYPQFDIVNRSFSGDHSTDKGKYNTIILSASGNSEDYPSLDVLDPAVIGVGAVTLATNGMVYRDLCGWNMDNLPIEQSVEIMGFTNLWTSEGMYGGTSCATPFISGILALVAGDYKSKGLRLTTDKVRDMLKSVANTGILKNAYEIDYSNGTKTIIGRESEPETSPIKIGYGYPNMALYKSPAIPTFPDDTIKLTIGSNVMKKYGKDVIIPQPPLIINGVTMLPLRVLAEALGMEVDWDGPTKTVTLRGKDNDD